MAQKKKFSKGRATAGKGMKVARSAKKGAGKTFKKARVKERSKGAASLAGGGALTGIGALGLTSKRGGPATKIAGAYLVVSGSGSAARGARQLVAPKNAGTAKLGGFDQARRYSGKEKLR